ncbi:MAG: hypothetical protein AAFX99_09810 [Myxococcota bacterium]
MTSTRRTTTHRTTTDLSALRVYGQIITRDPSVQQQPPEMTAEEGSSAQRRFG